MVGITIASMIKVASIRIRLSSRPTGPTGSRIPREQAAVTSVAARHKTVRRRSGARSGAWDGDISEPLRSRPPPRPLALRRGAIRGRAIIAAPLCRRRRPRATGAAPSPFPRGHPPPALQLGRAWVGGGEAAGLDGAGGLVGGDDRADGRDLMLDHPKGAGRAAVAEQALAGAEHEREDH